MSVFTEFAWQIQVIILTYITLLLVVIAVHDRAGGNILRFLTGLKKLVAVKPVKFVDWLFNKLKDFLGIK